MDASALLFGWYGFLKNSDPRMLGTWQAVRQRLGAGPGLFYRYEQSINDREGAFGICSFWASEFLARGGGSLAEARQVFDHALSHANDLGLFAEEIDPSTGAAMGNFPQAYTHVGLINAALSIHAREQQEGHT